MFSISVCSPLRERVPFSVKINHGARGRWHVYHDMYGRGAFPPASDCTVARGESDLWGSIWEEQRRRTGTVGGEGAGEGDWGKCCYFGPLYKKAHYISLTKPLVHAGTCSHAQWLQLAAILDWASIPFPFCLFVCLFAETWVHFLKALNK